MKFEIAPLPYEQNALEPYISARTVQFHYEKHHQGYMDKLKAAIEKTDDAKKSLADIISGTDKGTVYNLAAQVWNHSFYWQCMQANGGGHPGADIKAAINEHFSSEQHFIDELKHAANTQFGSGWAWLVKDKEGKLSVMSTGNAENPISQGYVPLLTIDVWEHAYYLDYQNNRAAYIDTFFANLVNWEFVESNLKSSDADIRGLY